MKNIDRINWPFHSPSVLFLYVMYTARSSDVITPNVYQWFSLDDFVHLSAWSFLTSSGRYNKSFMRTYSIPSVADIEKYVNFGKLQNNISNLKVNLWTQLLYKTFVRFRLLLEIFEWFIRYVQTCKRYIYNYLNLAISRIISRFFASNWLISSLWALVESIPRHASDGTRPCTEIKINYGGNNTVNLLWQIQKK